MCKIPLEEKYIPKFCNAPARFFPDVPGEDDMM